MISYFTKRPLSNAGGFNLGGINASGQASNHILFHQRSLMFFPLDSFYPKQHWPHRR